MSKTRTIEIQATRDQREMLTHYLEGGPEIEVVGGGGTRRGGKAAPLDSLIVTPHGLRTMGSLRLGSLVSNPDGTIAKVIGIYPQGIIPCYRITCDDGSSTRASADHLWNVRFTCSKFKAQRETGKWKVATTKQIMERGQWSNAMIPLTKPVKFTRGQHSLPPVDPYALGLLIGDGHLGNKRVDFSTADFSLIFALECGLGIRFKTIDKQNYTSTNAALMNELKKMGLYGQKSGTKFIPAQYQLLSTEDRMALLQGLMDTDGYVDTRSHCSYTSVSSQLAKDVQMLAWGLGYKASISQTPASYKDKNGDRVQCQDAYTVWINGPNLTDLFRLMRKKTRCVVRDKEAFRTIVSIVPEGECEMQCIAVDHPNSLYLADDFIVTHNTWTGAQAIGWRRMLYPGTRALCIRTVQKSADMNMGEELKRQFFRAHGFPLGSRNKGQVKYLEGDAQFHIPNGSMIQIGYCKHPNDWEQHLGNQWDDIWIEQAEQHPERVFDRLKGSNFPNHPDIVPRMLLTFNPGGIGSEWLERRICNPATRDKRVAWVKASIRDCYATLEADPSYIQRVLLKIQDPVLRAQWLDGDFDVQHGLYFRLMTEHDATGPTVREMNVPYWADWYCGVDWGDGHGKFAVIWAAHWTDTDKYGKEVGRHLHVGGEVYEGNLAPDLQAKRAVEHEAHLRRKFPFFHEVSQRWADPSTGKPVETASTMASYSIASMWWENGFQTYPSFRYSPVSGWQMIKYLLRKGILTIDPECMALIKEFRGAIRKEDSEDIDKNRCPNHALDGLRYLSSNVFGLDYSAEPEEEERYEWARSN